MAEHSTPSARRERVPQPPDEAPRTETARYIVAMSAELAALARGAQLDLLAYFLEMARMEAAAETDKARRRKSRPGGA